MIDTDTFMTLSFLLSFGVPMYLAWRELDMVKPRRRRDGDGNAPRPTADPPLPSGDDALPPLPQSLRDAAKGRPSPVRPRVRELV